MSCSSASLVLSSAITSQRTTDGVLHWRRRGPVGLTDGEMTDASAGDMTKTIDTDQCAIHRNATTNLVKTKKPLDHARSNGLS